MRILLVAAGRSRSGIERELYAHYAARLVWPIELKEIEVRTAALPAEQRKRESALLLAAVPKVAKVVALDEHGKLLTSEGFAKQIGGWRDEGVAEIAFLIGGAGGLDDAVRKSADLVLSLGRVTWPHLLMRGLLAEQLYRAQQILAGHPYHRGS
jgi:23S rRNA (pseudouridine1915-N3)-methyltransferase